MAQPLRVCQAPRGAPERQGVARSGAGEDLKADAGALFSACRRYRYRLWRSWGEPSARCVFVGLNPSTADERLDDPTIRKCIGFARRWGFGAVEVVNLFAWCATEPRRLLEAAPRHVGRGNGAALARAFESAQRIVWAWGSHDARVQRLVRARLATDAWRRLPHCAALTGTIGRTKDGSPRHPLMAPYASPFAPDPAT